MATFWAILKDITFWATFDKYGLLLISTSGHTDPTHKLHLDYNSPMSIQL